MKKGCQKQERNEMDKEDEDRKLVFDSVWTHFGFQMKDKWVDVF